MTVERFGETTILVTLQQEDMHRYNLNFDPDADTDGILQGLRGLLLTIGERCGLYHRGRSYLIEALPGRDGWLLIISVRRTGGRRYRIKRRGSADCCRFFDADALLGWLSLRQYAISSGELYEYEGAYLLLSDRRWTDRERFELHEYGVLTRESPVNAARVREYAVLVKP